MFMTGNGLLCSTWSLLGFNEKARIAMDDGTYFSIYAKKITYFYGLLKWMFTFAVSIADELWLYCLS